MEEFDDETLMLRVRNGDLDPLNLLFERHSGVLYAFFMKRTREHSLSEDLTQEVFLRVLKYRKTFKPEGSFRAWLFRIARNVQVRQWSRRFSKLHVLQDDPESGRSSEPIDAHEDRPDEKAMRSEDADLLYAALEKLSDEKRQLVVLRRIQNQSYAEMAELLGCEPKSLKVRVHRAVAELAKLLKSSMKDQRYELPNLQ